MSHSESAVLTVRQCYQPGPLYHDLHEVEPFPFSDSFSLLCSTPFAALGRGAKAGSAAALDALVAAVRAETERINRAGMHGLSAAGQAGVPALLQLIAGTVPSLAMVNSIGAQARLVAKQCVHALAEALEQPDVETVTALVNFASSARGALIACVESPDVQRYKAATAELRQIVATSMASLGCIAERSVLLQDITACSIIADCLIEVAGSEEVGSGVGGTPDAATAIPELARYVLLKKRL